MKKMCAVLAVVTLLSGCVVYPGHGDGRGHGHGNDRGDFCPPGQAKKGNC
ncbi:MAG: hypothetical protein RRY35_01350 [Clostridiales bacterium]